uniref:Candidate secreted effector n=1 Tax=Meloidogyne incognita TaxID=6306 RepID=A0A914MQC8_MELIC
MTWANDQILIVTNLRLVLIVRAQTSYCALSQLQPWISLLKTIRFFRPITIACRTSFLATASLLLTTMSTRRTTSLLGLRSFPSCSCVTITRWSRLATASTIALCFFPFRCFGITPFWCSSALFCVDSSGALSKQFPHFNR